MIVSIFYMLGVSLLVFHLANGLWTAAITWGVTLTQRSMRRWGYVCAVIGVALMAAAWSAVIGFAVLDYDDARATEQAMLDGTIHMEGAPDPAEATPAGESVGAALPNP